MCFYRFVPWRGTSVFGARPGPLWYLHVSCVSFHIAFFMNLKGVFLLSSVKAPQDTLHPFALCCCVVPNAPSSLSEVSIVAVCSVDGLVLRYHDCEHFWSRTRTVMAGEWLLWIDWEEMPPLLPAGSMLQGFSINCHFCPVVFHYFFLLWPPQRQFYKVFCPTILQLLQATLERILS